MADFRAQVALGKSLVPVGQLRFTRDGPRQFSAFNYDAAWLDNPRAFAVQPDFPVRAGIFHMSGRPGNTRDALPGCLRRRRARKLGSPAAGARLWQRPFGIRISDAVRRYLQAG